MARVGQRPKRISADAFTATAEAHSRQDLSFLVEQFGSRVEEQNFARLNSWTLDPRKICNRDEPHPSAVAKLPRGMTRD
jgi:hypothetical protein